MKAVLLVLVVAGCAKTRDVECGEGTQLRDGKCVAVTAATVAAPTLAADASVVVDASPPPVDGATADPWQVPPDAPIAEASRWLHFAKADSMRGTTTQYARLPSNNAVPFDFPYNGGQRAILTFVRHPNKRVEAYLQIEKGQFDCGFDGCSTSVKLDAGKVRTLWMSRAESADAIFFGNAQGLIADIKKAKRVIVEAKFFGEGKRQFEFDVVGFEWPK